MRTLYGDERHVDARVREAEEDAQDRDGAHEGRDEGREGEHDQPVNQTLRLRRVSYLGVEEVEYWGETNETDESETQSVRGSDGRENATAGTASTTRDTDHSRTTAIKRSAAMVTTSQKMKVDRIAWITSIVGVRELIAPWTGNRRVQRQAARSACDRSRSTSMD